MQPKESATTVADMSWSGCSITKFWASSMMHWPFTENLPMTWTYDCAFAGVSYQEPLR